MAITMTLDVVSPNTTVRAGQPVHVQATITNGSSDSVNLTSFQPFCTPNGTSARFGIAKPSPKANIQIVGSSTRIVGFDVVFDSGPTGVTTTVETQYTLNATATVSDGSSCQSTNSPVVNVVPITQDDPYLPNPPTGAMWTGPFTSNAQVYWFWA